MEIKTLFFLIKALGLLNYFPNLFYELEDGTITTIKDFHLIKGFGSIDTLFVGAELDDFTEMFNRYNWYSCINDFGAPEKRVVKIFEYKYWKDPNIKNIKDIEKIDYKLLF